MPQILRGQAAKLWPDVVGKLIAEGDWDDHDREFVTALFCTYCAVLFRAIEDVSTHGAVGKAAVTGVARHSPHIKVLREAADGVMRYGGLLNLTPAERYVRHNRSAYKGHESMNT